MEIKVGDEVQVCVSGRVVHVERDNGIIQVDVTSSDTVAGDVLTVDMDDETLEVLRQHFPEGSEDEDDEDDSFRPLAEKVEYNTFGDSLL